MQKGDGLTVGQQQLLDQVHGCLEDYRRARQQTNELFKANRSSSCHLLGRTLLDILATDRFDWGNGSVGLRVFTREVFFELLVKRKVIDEVSGCRNIPEPLFETILCRYGQESRYRVASDAQVRLDVRFLFLGAVCCLQTNRQD